MRGHSIAPRPGLRAGIGFAVGLAVLLTALGAQGPTASARLARASHKRTTRRTTTIAPGLTLTTLTTRRPPNKIRVLTLTPSSELTLDVALANETIPGHEQTSSMARRRGAVAAINGDYTLRPLDVGAGRPIDTFASDGDLVTSPLIWGRNFALSADEQTAYFGHAPLSIEMFENDAGAKWKIRGWNGWADESSSGLLGYSPTGGHVFRPLADACSVRLYPAGPTSWSPNGGVTHVYVVDEVKCSKRRLARRGGVVLSAPRYDKRATRLEESLVPNETVTITWSLGWPGVLDTIGGNPDVLEDGRLAAGECTVSYFCRRNPRTGVGARDDGTILMVTVDGRQTGKSVGMTPDEFGRLFRSLGATWALNMDGGGSTTMVVRNKVVNVPSDGYERSVGSSLLVLPGPDSAEPSPLPYQSPTALPTEVPTPAESPNASATWLVPDGERAPDPDCEALLDPGSTGGMLDALSRGELTRGPVRLPRSLLAAVRTFRNVAGCPAQRFAQ